MCKLPIYESVPSSAYNPLNFQEALVLPAEQEPGKGPPAEGGQHKDQASAVGQKRSIENIFLLNIES